MIAYATLEKLIGQPDSCPEARPESPGLGDTNLRMLRGANMAPSPLSRFRCRLCGLWREGGRTLPKNCNRLQQAATLLVEWIERPDDCCKKIR
jgi:hypothetical protein